MDQQHFARVGRQIAGRTWDKQRSDLREERHPNAVTAPPINRGSMTPRPWRGFWNSLGTAALMAVPGMRQAAPQRAAETTEAWQHAANRRRMVLMLIVLLTSGVATSLFAAVQPNYDNLALEIGQLSLFALLSAWIVSGFGTALMGFFVVLRGDPHALSVKEVKDHAMPTGADARTAIIMPICNEDVGTVFAGLRATCESVLATGQGRAFDVFVLSDSNKPENQQAERAAWEDLRAVLAAEGGPSIEVYYRLRTRRTHRKAGNVADFCRRWGKDYKYMVVLDADSVMSGDCLTSMVKLMEAHPRAGIIQTATQSIGHQTLHARAQQFASRMTGRLFTLGMQYWQLGESHYWGHNAILRMQPFMEHCALAPISGTGGMSGGIMSHDFVEAALMRRAGYHVWLVSDLVGSYEQQPPDLLSELQRDRRWCQGNLQNARLMAEPGIAGVHRAMFITGAMSYLSAPLWLAFMTLGTALWLSGTPQTVGLQSFDTTLSAVPAELVGLWVWTLAVLFLPRLLGMAAVLVQGEQRRYGGTLGLIKSAALESVMAMLQSPVRMLAHSLFVLVAMTGLKLEWKSPPREAEALSWGHAARSLAPMSAIVALLGVGISLIDPTALVWLVPVGLPLLLAIPMSVLTSRSDLGAAMRRQRWLLIPEESWSPAVLRRAWLHASRPVRQLALAA
jgi:membrane glycosyltransferase